MSLRRSRGCRWLLSLGAVLLSGLMTSCGTADQPASQVEQPVSYYSFNADGSLVRIVKLSGIGLTDPQHTGFLTD